MSAKREPAAWVITQGTRSFYVGSDEFIRGGFDSAACIPLYELTPAEKAAPDLLEALKAVLARDKRNTCQHEETHRAGSIWEVCDGCGAKWADDEGGKPEWEDPKEWAAASAAILKATGESE